MGQRQNAEERIFRMGEKEGTRAIIPIQRSHSLSKHHTKKKCKVLCSLPLLSTHQTVGITQLRAGSAFTCLSKTPDRPEQKQLSISKGHTMPAPGFPHR